MPMPATASPRKEELLDRAYAYVLEHGLAAMSLRPLAAAIGSSPRVLLYLFGSKEGLTRALLARARADELEALAVLRDGDGDGDGGDVGAVAGALWAWLSAPGHRGVLVLWLEGYARSLTEPDGPWGGFARSTVDDWLGLLGAAQPAAVRRTRAGEAQRTAVLGILRGGLLDLLATQETARVTRAVERELARLCA
jgi:AcrR family transcriptional regulator